MAAHKIISLTTILNCVVAGAMVGTVLFQWHDSRVSANTQERSDAAKKGAADEKAIELEDRLNVDEKKIDDQAKEVNGLATLLVRVDERTKAIIRVINPHYQEPTDAEVRSIEIHRPVVERASDHGANP